MLIGLAVAIAFHFAAPAIGSALAAAGIANPLIALILDLTPSVITKLIRTLNTRRPPATPTRPTGPYFKEKNGRAPRPAD